MKLIVLLLVIVQSLGLIEAIPDCPEGQKFCVSNMACNDCCADNDCETGSECNSFNECSTIMIDDDNTDPDIAEPCGGLQCIDELHCCNLAVGCQQCCSKHHCKRWEKCLGYKCVPRWITEEEDNSAKRKDRIGGWNDSAGSKYSKL